MASNCSSTVTIRKVRVGFLGSGSFLRRLLTWDRTWARGGDAGLGWADSVVVVVVGELGGSGSGGLLEWLPQVDAR
jgi:hypothetical protein